jgi:hypothetical protein
MLINLPGSKVMPSMLKILENLFEANKIEEHGMTVGKKLGFMLSGGNTDISQQLPPLNIKPNFLPTVMPCSSILFASNKFSKIFNIEGITFDPGKLINISFGGV